MRKFRNEASREEVQLFPRSINEYVGESDGVRYVDAFVEELDLSLIENKYQYLGRPGYHPRTLVKILVYGTIRGIRSSRELARACQENLRFIYLARDEKPDFRTISNFRKNHLKELGSLLKQTVRIGLKEGFITLDQVSIDGTKLRANASKNSFKSPEKLEKLLEALCESLEQGEREDEKEDDKHGDDDGNMKLPEGLEARRDLVSKIRKALKHHEDFSEKKSVSTTDPEAHFMKGQNGTHPCYNAQAAVDTSSYLIVGARATVSGSDHGELKENIKDIVANTGRKPKSISADKGYRATEGLEYADENEIEAFVALQETSSKIFSHDDFEYDAEHDEYTCPAGRVLEFQQEKEREDIYQCEDCSNCSISQQCLAKIGAHRTLRVHHGIAVVQRAKHRIETEEGKQAMKLRAHTVELVFAWMKSHRKLRRFFMRSLSDVNDLWKFEASVTNIHRLISLRVQKIESLA
jgi:transposase